jgi:hypothetical protein
MKSADDIHSINKSFDNRIKGTMENIEKMTHALEKLTCPFFYHINWTVKQLCQTHRQQMGFPTIFWYTCGLRGGAKGGGPAGAMAPPKAATQTIIYIYIYSKFYVSKYIYSKFCAAQLIKDLIIRFRR